MKTRIATVDGSYNPSEWFEMEDNLDGTYSFSFGMSAGVTYGYNFNNSNGSGYESGSGLGDCASGTYGNDRFISIPSDAVPGSVIEVPVVCWESCEACPTDIPGCMDETLRTTILMLQWMMNHVFMNGQKLLTYSSLNMPKAHQIINI